MKVVVVGSTGTIGSAVAAALSDAGHEVIGATRTGDIKVNLSDQESIKSMYSKIGTVDAVVCCAGRSNFGPLADLTDEDFAVTLAERVMGQVNLVRFGMDHVSDNGVFVLTTGGLGTFGEAESSPTGLANMAVEGFVRCAAYDLARGIRITAVKPPWITQTAIEYGVSTEGSITADEAARAYVAMITGQETGVAVMAKDYADR